MIFPNNIGFEEFEIISNAPSYVSESNSLKTIALSTGVQRWEVSLTTSRLNEKDFRGAWAFLNSLSGKAKTFDIRLPLLSDHLGVVSGQVQSLSDHAVGDNIINFNNYEAVAGDHIRFAGHSKVYQISNVSGSSATIYPSLFHTVSSGEAIKVSGLLFTARLNSQVSKLKVNSSKIARLKFKIIEAF